MFFCCYFDRSRHNVCTQHVVWYLSIVASRKKKLFYWKHVCVNGCVNKSNFSLIFSCIWRRKNGKFAWVCFLSRDSSLPFFGFTKLCVFFVGDVEICNMFFLHVFLWFNGQNSYFSYQSDVGIAISFSLYHKISSWMT